MSTSPRFLLFIIITINSTTKKAKISEGNLERENVKSLSNSVTKFYDQGICESFFFPSLICLPNFAFPSSII